jgi:hypothetical protein
MKTKIPGNRRSLPQICAAALALTAIWTFAPMLAEAQPPPVDLSRGPLSVSENGRYLVHKDGTPFFYLGDTAWQLIHDLDREEAELYLQDRRRKGFTVIQAVVLAEYGGLDRPNPYGHVPLRDKDPARPNEAYFAHVDFIVNRAEALGMYIGMLPTWGDKWNKRWGEGPEIFTPENARTYGEFLGNRYSGKPIIWILGGDRIPEKDEHFAIIRAKAEGIRKAVGNRQLITFHPMGGNASSRFFHKDPWLDFNMFQSGHGRFYIPNYKQTLADRALTPVKPVLDGEPCYEDHPVNWNPNHGWFGDFDVRLAAYWSMLAGAAGHTYGDHNIWQMWHPERRRISHARTPWREALHHPGSAQMGVMRRLMEEMEWWRLEPARDLARQAAAPEAFVQTRRAHVVYARAATGEAVFYVNGKEVARRQLPGKVTVWQGQMRLGLANELSDARPWLGVYHGVAIYNRALTAQEATAHYQQGKVVHTRGLQAHYTFQEGEGAVIRDRSGQAGALDLHIGDTQRMAWSQDGLQVRQPVLIATRSAATRLTQAVQNSGAFTLEAWITPASVEQAGPARIVTLSDGVSNRNFTLGQLEGAYEMRFRTTETTANGEPPLRTPGADESFHVAAARSANGDRAVIYAPRGGRLSVSAGILRSGLRAEWFDPRTGARQAANSDSAGHFVAPSDQDWVLLFR